MKSQFCRLIWMLCSRNTGKIQIRSLRLVTNDKTGTFEHLLQTNNDRYNDTSEKFVSANGRSF